ncbi:MAG: RidA family protein, partial [Candidatus Bathyarchaeia archaeon]
VGNLIFISGCQGQNDESLEIPLTFEEQMVNALDKVKKAVEEAGSSMNNIIKTLIFLKNLEDYPRMRKTELEYYQKYAPSLVENPPASTVAIVASLARPEFLVEIDAIGYIP